MSFLIMYIPNVFYIISLQLKKWGGGEDTTSVSFFLKKSTAHADYFPKILFDCKDDYSNHFVNQSIQHKIKFCEIFGFGQN